MTPKRAYMLARRIVRDTLRAHPTPWKIYLYCSPEPPAWLRDEPDAETMVGCCTVVDEYRNRARIWIRSTLSHREFISTVYHECLHLLFATAGIDSEDIHNAIQRRYAHQLIYALGELLARLSYRRWTPRR